MLKVFFNFFGDGFYNFLQKKYSDKPITIFIDRKIHDISEIQSNPYNILILNEPNEFFGLHNWAYYNWRYFTTILTWNDQLLNSIPNTFKFCANSSDYNKKFIKTLSRNPKQFEVSFLCGIKDLAHGHKLRHEIYKTKDLFNIPKKWHYVLEDFDHINGVRPGYAEYSKDLSHIPKGILPEIYGKKILFENSMFNIAVENYKYLNFYTEKLTQNFIAKTIPIYWGCPNISEMGYDERGIIRFDTVEDLIHIANNLTPEVYEKMKPYVEYNHQLSLQDTIKNQYYNFFDQLIQLYEI
jgi:hypothetical protein